MVDKPRNIRSLPPLFKKDGPREAALIQRFNFHHRSHLARGPNFSPDGSYSFLSARFYGTTVYGKDKFGTKETAWAPTDW
jgi:hypothetical protein